MKITNWLSTDIPAEKKLIDALENCHKHFDGNVCLDLILEQPAEMLNIFKRLGYEVKFDSIVLSHTKYFKFSIQDASQNRDAGLTVHVVDYGTRPLVIEILKSSFHYLERDLRNKTGIYQDKNLLNKVSEDLWDKLSKSLAEFNV